ECPHCGERESIFGDGGGQEAADTLGVPLFAQVPLVPALRAGGDTGLPIVVTDPDSSAAVALRSAAREIARSTRTKVGKPLPLMAQPGAAAAAGGHQGHTH
ncbi:MAG: P-loop NTPase, partial [Actinomycetota bacterium]